MQWKKWNRNWPCLFVSETWCLDTFFFKIPKLRLTSYTEEDDSESSIVYNCKEPGTYWAAHASSSEILTSPRLWKSNNQLDYVAHLECTNIIITMPCNLTLPCPFMRNMTMNFFLDIVLVWHFFLLNFYGMYLYFYDWLRDISKREWTKNTQNFSDLPDCLCTLISSNKITHVRLYIIICYKFFENIMWK